MVVLLKTDTFIIALAYENARKQAHSYNNSILELSQHEVRL